ncbi:MAG: TetR/AcrR family transcriptional regulator [Chthonomonadales bacterium]
MRETILDAAIRLMQRYGYRKTTMEDLAREAGIGKGTIYLYFPSKEEVALACADRANARVFRQLEEIASAHTPPAERLRAMLVARILIRFDAVQHVAHMLDELWSELRPAFMLRRSRYLAEEARIFQRVLADGVQARLFDAKNLQHTAEALITATNSLLPMNLAPPELEDREDVERRASALADLLLHGLLRRTDPGAQEVSSE